jgi:hypothetical protein
VKFRIVSNLVLVRTGHVARVSVAVQSNGTWMDPHCRLPSATMFSASSTGCHSTQADGSSSRRSSMIRWAIPRPESMLVKSLPQLPSTSLIHSGRCSALAMSRTLVRPPVP